MACNRYCKSTLTIYSNILQTLGAGSPVVFYNTQEKSGESISFVDGNSTINIRSAGLYLIEYSVTASADNTNVTMQLFKNSVAIPSTTKTATSTGNTDYVNIKDSVVVDVRDVCPCSGNGTTTIPIMLVTANASTVANASINIVKLA